MKILKENLLTIVVGAGEDEKFLGWKTMRRIAIAWVITIPSSAIVAASFYYFVTFIMWR